MKRFADLTEQEVLALAITNEEEDSRIYRGFADGLREQYPGLGQGVRGDGGRGGPPPRPCCSTSTATKFGEYLPLIRRQDVKGFVASKPLWLVRPLGLDEVRKYAADHGVRDRALLPQGGRDRARRLGARSS